MRGLLIAGGAMTGRASHCLASGQAEPGADRKQAQKQIDVLRRPFCNRRGPDCSAGLIVDSPAPEELSRMRINFLEE